MFVYRHLLEMGMQKLQMGTMWHGSDSMDEVTHQLAVVYGFSGEYTILHVRPRLRRSKIVYQIECG